VCVLYFVLLLCAVLVLCLMGLAACNKFFVRSFVRFHYLGFSGVFLLEKSGLIFKRAVATLDAKFNVQCLVLCKVLVLVL